jgi:flagellar basal body L-ring protein FlgH
MKRLFIIMIVFVLSFVATNAQFRSQEQSLRSLFSDVKAFQVDDAIMVLIIEDTQANNGAESIFEIQYTGDTSYNLNKTE